MQNIIIFKNFIEVLYSSNLTEELRNEFLTQEEQDQDCDIEVKNVQCQYYAESSSVNIDKIITQLNKLKAKGSTHVAIDFHCDHVEYELYGYVMEKESDEAKSARIALQEEKKRQQKENYEK